MHGQVFQSTDASEPADPTMGLVQFRGVGVIATAGTSGSRVPPRRMRLSSPLRRRSPSPGDPGAAPAGPGHRTRADRGTTSPNQEQVQGQQFRMQKAVFDVLMAVRQGEHQLIRTQPKPSVPPQNLDQLRLVSGAEVVLESLLQSSGADLHAGTAHLNSDFEEVHRCSL